MGKDFLNGNWGVIIKLGLLILALGAAGQMLRSHDTRIGDVETKAHATEIENVGIKKDIERLDDKIRENETRQETFRTEQRKAYENIFERLPKNE